MEVLIPKIDRANREKSRAFSNFRESAGGHLFWGLWLMLVCFGLNESRGQMVSHEYPLKAVFLLNFAHYTDWPTNAFAESDSPFIFGVLGDDPFGTLLDYTVRDEKVNGRKIVLEHYRHVDDIKTCHILYISQSESRRLGKILADLKGRPILTVSDIENSADQSVCIQFLTENNKIRLQINTNSLQTANLAMSSKLLRAAEIIPSRTK